MIERTLVAIKPDGVKRALVGEIIKRLETKGLKIVAMKMIWPTSEFAKRHYSAHLEKPFYPSLERFITSGPVVAIVIEGISAVELVRKIVGGTEPKSALPGTIRGDYAHHSYSFTDKINKSIHNLIHASGNKEEAEQEIKLWFTYEEIHDYRRSDQDLVM
jgi:nucleoside-diphosphate kinase